MIRERILLPEVKSRIRNLMDQIIIEHNLSLSDVAKEATASYKTVYTFMNTPSAIKVRGMLKLAHFITKYGYSVEDIINGK